MSTTTTWHSRYHTLLLLASRMANQCGGGQLLVSVVYSLTLWCIPGKTLFHGGGGGDDDDADDDDGEHVGSGWVGFFFVSFPVAL